MAQVGFAEVTINIDAPEDVRLILAQALAMRAAIVRTLRACPSCSRGECRAGAHTALREAANVTAAEIRARE